MNKKKIETELYKRLIALESSPLYSFRKANNYVPVLGSGSLNADIVFIGEAPGKNEAMTGKPFVGAAGKILDDMLESINLKREDVYITNIVNDRPPENRDPKPKEIEIYTPILEELLELISPKIIATLGRFSMEFILKKFGVEDIKTITEMHGKAIEFHSEEDETVIVVPLYHPAATIYNQKLRPELKKDFEVMSKIINS